MACETWKTKFDTYIDGELPLDEMRTFDAHVRTCAACAADALSRVQMKRSIQNAGKRFSATPEFRKKILHSIEAKPRRSSIGFGWIRIVRAATVAATLLVVLGLALIYRGREHARAEQVYSEAVDLHVAMLASSSPVDVVSSDRHTVKPWFQGKIPFTFDLPELQNSEFSLLGGRLTYIHQAVGAQLIYEVRKHRISVFIFREDSLRDKLDGNAAVEKQKSFNMNTWTQGGLRYIVIGDASSTDISNLSKLFNHQTT